MNILQQVKPHEVHKHMLNNQRIQSVEPLISPAELLAQLPISLEAANIVHNGRQEIEAVISGEDNRLMIIIGPCSIHDPKAALEYAKRLTLLREQFGDRLLIVMRVYFEKPRTTTGWKGYINDPNLTGPSDFNTGRRLARELLMQINELGVPVATEILEPLNPPFFADLISWGAIGARTTESQIHREMASGLSFPVGIKNGTGGSRDIAVQAMVAARSPHTFLGIDEQGRQSQIRSSGNECTQLILRGGSDGPNFNYKTVTRAVELLNLYDLPKHIIVDCSHANADKKFQQQARVLRYVLKHRSNPDYPVSGVMIESNLKEGKQELTVPSELEYGVSITDGCVGWEETECLLKEAHRRT